MLEGVRCDLALHITQVTITKLLTTSVASLLGEKQVMFLFPCGDYSACLMFLVFPVFICEHKDFLLPKFYKVSFHSLIYKNLLTCACYKLDLCGCEYEGSLCEVQGAIPWGTDSVRILRHTCKCPV